MLRWIRAAIIRLQHRETLLLALNVVGAPPRSGSQHNEVRPISTTGVQCIVVRGWRMRMLGLGCHFGAGLPSDLVELFLQDKIFAQVVGPRGGPFDD
ncbi:hypothetical protein BHM03_00047544 [Ensete ventricosum]|nr:hypothetical protein BHM03_00047544 [Ensete ventricosum]